MPIQDQRAALQAIASRAMIREGLEPEWPPGTAAELARLRDAPTAGLRDLRRLPWSSIDNDDSRDLDQLEVCADERGRMRLLIAIADVDTLGREGLRDRPARTDQHHLRLHAGADLPDAARGAVDRSHVAQPGRGSRRCRDRHDPGG